MPTTNRTEVVERLRKEGLKVCSQCDTRKPLSSFGRDERSKTGYRAECKACNRARSRERYAANRTARREEKRLYEASHREEAKARVRAWRLKHPERRDGGDKVKRSARVAVRDAVHNGRVTKPESCEDCGGAFPKAKLHGHHEDYSKPLEVEWLCPECHGKRHWTDIEDGEAG